MHLSQFFNIHKCTAMGACQQSAIDILLKLTPCYTKYLFTYISYKLIVMSDP